MEIVLAGEPVKEALYTVDLYFVELNFEKPSERIFDVKIQDVHVLENFDIYKETGAMNKSLVKSIPGIRATDRIAIRCLPGRTAPKGDPVLCGIKITRSGVVSQE